MSDAASPSVAAALPSGLRRLLAPLRTAYLEARTLGRGLPIVLNARDDFRISPAARGLFPPVYEPEALGWLRARVRPGDRCWNVGANIGVWTLCLARWSGPGGTVVAFEPNPSARRYLRRHLRLNGCAGRVTIRAEAVGARTGTATFFAAGPNGMARLGGPNPLLPSTKPVSVPVTTLDAAAVAAGHVPDVLTMDIEGGELDALAGAARTVGNGAIRLLVVEMHPTAWPVYGWTPARASELLGDLGLRLAPLTGQSDPLTSYGIVAAVPDRA